MHLSRCISVKINKEMDKSTDCEAGRQFLDVVQRNVDPHHAENQLILVLRRHENDRECKTPTVLIGHLSPVQTFHYSHLAVPVVFALRLIENRKGPCDDQTQLLREFQRKNSFSRYYLQ